MTGTNTQSRRISGFSAAVVVAGAAGAMLAVPATASAATSHTTFVGHCSTVGKDSSDLRQSFYRGQGVCFGSLNGAPAKAHHVVEVIRQTGAPTGRQGVGTIVFGSTHRVLHFVIQSSLDQFTVEGATAGIASGASKATAAGLRLTTTVTTDGPLVG